MEVTESDDEEIESVRITQPLDYATEERQSRLSRFQPNWMAALGICILGACACVIVAALVWVLS